MTDRLWHSRPLNSPRLPAALRSAQARPNDMKPRQEESMRTKEFFSDDKGNPSSMRLMSMLALIVAGFLSLAPIFNWGSGPSEHVLYFLIAAFAPKAIQKFAEKGP